MHRNEARFRFYAELNDFLPEGKRAVEFPYRFQGKPSVKDAIEALGVPHTEVDLILVDGVSVGFDFHIRNRDRISVYPVFESLDISPVIRLRERPLRKTAFVLDCHLGRLARLLRMLGFDTVYRNDFEDPEIVNISLKEKRIILTRDRGILKTKAVTHGYWVRSNKPIDQVKEILTRFDLCAQMEPFKRCMNCNGLLKVVDKASIQHRLQPATRKYYDAFWICTGCRRIYWKGTHYDGMKRLVDSLGDMHQIA